MGMTQLFRKDGWPLPVTVLEAGPCTVVQVKTHQKDGYDALQLGFGDRDPKRVAKPVAGHFAKAKVQAQAVLREFRQPPQPEPGGFKLGDALTVSLFKPGDRVNVTGRSLGKGFRGGMARWNWRGGPQTHGSMSHRAPGSIGASSNPSRVFRGQHLPGHMGDRTVTTEALEVVQVDVEKHLLLVKGAVPGRNQGVVLIRPSRKPPKRQVELPKAPPQKQKAQAAAKEAKKEPSKKESKPAAAAKPGGKK